MTIFDLLFIATFLFASGSALAAVVLLMWRRNAAAKRMLLALIAYLSVYFGVLIATSNLSKQRHVAMGEIQCFDDWCLRVVDVAYVAAPKPGNTLAIVTMEVSNRGRARAQSEPQTFVYIVDDREHTYWQSMEAQAEYERLHARTRALTSMIAAGDAISAKQVFELPKSGGHLALIIGHPFGPGFFVIGDSDSFLHKRTIVPLPNVP
jgi:hypothetical protein